MDTSYHVIRGTVLLIIAVAVAGWVLIRVLKRSEDPARLLFKLLLTAVVIGFMVWKVAPLVAAGGYAGAFGGIPLAAACGLALALTWVQNLTDIIARPFTALFDGGDAKIEPRPFYSIAEARRKRGQYTEAVAEIHKQLSRFPTDFEGQMMLAEIRAENLNDLPGAEVTICRLCAQPGHAPRNVAFALNSLADWHLKYGLDRAAAEQDLQMVAERFPDTELALLAAQRIAHLPGTDAARAARHRAPVPVPQGIHNLGLLQTPALPSRNGEDMEKAAAQYVEHLTAHPHDTEAREKLAVIYADHYGRLDLAADQLNQLIEQPNQPPKSVAHWLNLLADLQVRHGSDMGTVRATLERIIERSPDHAVAEIARNRLNLLKLEIKARGQPAGVKMGTYEQNIGLKRGMARPGQFGA